MQRVFKSMIKDYAKYNIFRFTFCSYFNLSSIKFYTLFFSFSIRKMCRGAEVSEFCHTFVTNLHNRSETSFDFLSIPFIHLAFALTCSHFNITYFQIEWMTESVGRMSIMPNNQTNRNATNSFKES